MTCLFLFQTGAIKSCIVDDDGRITHIDGFYSKLVRLKENGSSSNITVARFLFQTGAIKSLKDTLTAKRLRKFLFQTGAIKSNFCF